MDRQHILHFILFVTIFTISSTSQLIAQTSWEQVKTENEPSKRHENAFVKVGTKFYLLGGRGMKPVEIYDPATATWSEGQMPPVEMSHFQSVAYHGMIYVMGGLQSGWPSETPLSHIYIYDTVEDLWVVGPEIPKDRQRGAAGVFVYEDKIYMVCGIINGHTSGWVSWFDVYDPKTNTWSKLPNAPRARDHFQAAVVGDQLVVTGGRKSGYQGQGFEATIAETDMYDFSTGKWITLPSSSGDIPTQRAGCTAVVVGDEVIVIGGESGSQEKAHSEVEVFNAKTKKWRKLPSLNTGRHGTQVIYSEGNLYIAAGCGNRGGAPELNSFETYVLKTDDTNKDVAIVDGKLSTNAESITFEKVKPYFSNKKSITLKNAEGNQGVLLTYVISTDQSSFTVDFPYELPYMINPGETVDVELTFTPKDTNSTEGEILIKSSDRGNKQPLSIKLKGN
ncbi:Kelch repeat-containing protein [Chondrinema litorale]|uniref:Kelch repeat-containing protein n=1 Tax=Chondrinema litorale TaxID=2994555 RepID=UPI0025433B2C|nr:kelch repeat-containing protein [Chondrinema litorale]UZR97014.1 galactose oxidase [Chondrinema litorale]